MGSDDFMTVPLTGDPDKKTTVASVRLGDSAVGHFPLVVSRVAVGLPAPALAGSSVGAEEPEHTNPLRSNQHESLVGPVWHLHQPGCVLRFSRCAAGHR